MKRIKGYIDLNGLLNIEKEEEKSPEEILIEIQKNDSSVTVRKNAGRNSFVFSFWCNQKEYFFKYDFLISKFCYNELMAYYIAKDLGLDCVKYDLATIGGYKGVISESYKKVDANYISGYEIIMNTYGHEAAIWGKTTLEEIWQALEEYYKNRPNMQEIVASLMDEIVKMFLFDELVGQSDRNITNWEIAEYSNGEIKLCPIFDNSRFLNCDIFDLKPLIKVDDNFEKNMYNDIMLGHFLDISSSEYLDLLSSYLWVIREENINKIINQIEKETNCPMPEDLKKKYQEHFKINYSFFTEELAIPDIKGSR